MTVVSTVTYEAEMFEGPNERYPDVAGREIEPGVWLCSLDGRYEYMRKGQWILTPSDKPQSRIICTDDYFKSFYKQCEPPNGAVKRDADGVSQAGR